MKRNMKGRIRAYRASGRMFGSTFSTDTGNARAAFVDANWSAYKAGFDAFEDEPRGSNPYAPGTQEFEAWGRGWSQAAYCKIRDEARQERIDA